MIIIIYLFNFRIISLLHLSLPTPSTIITIHLIKIIRITPPTHASLKTIISLIIFIIPLSLSFIYRFDAASRSPSSKLGSFKL